MNQEHKDIKYFLPYGESIRGFANQRFVPATDINKVLRNRGIFVFNKDKDYTVPLLQTLVLSPKEFDELRDAYISKEDNYKTISREIEWNDGIDLSLSNNMAIELDSFIKRQLPTCELKTPIRFSRVDNYGSDCIRAEFSILRHDINKSWYEQTNIFSGIVEFINDGGKGRVVIKHTAPETKKLADQIVREKVKQFKDKNMLDINCEPKKILFSEFNNRERFTFFFRLTSSMQNNIYFSFRDIKDISIKPDDDCETLPEKIEWMKRMKKIILSGESIGQTFFMKDVNYHDSLMLWNMVAVFDYTYRGESGIVKVNFGFPDFVQNGNNSEFEISVSLQTNKNSMDARHKKKLESLLQSEFDKQKSLVYSNFKNYLKQHDKSSV